MANGTGGSNSKQQSGSSFYKVVLKDPWPYWLGGILLGLLNIMMFVVTGNPWGITTAFALWGAWIYKALGGVVDNWAFFQGPNGKALAAGFFNHYQSVQNLGIIVGAFLATLLASQFKFKKIKHSRQVVAALGGGVLMGYGARIAFGCNIGAFFSGTASMSLHGWVYTVFIFVGAYIGSKILVRYLL